MFALHASPRFCYYPGLPFCIQSVGNAMELNLVYTKIKDLQARLDALRGYL